MGNDNNTKEPISSDNDNDTEEPVANDIDGTIFTGSETKTPDGGLEKPVRVGGDLAGGLEPHQS